MTAGIDFIIQYIMSTLKFKNLKNNSALAFFLGMEFLALVLAIGWLIYLTVTQTT
jgi:hypothetical protein